MTSALLILVVIVLVPILLLQVGTIRRLKVHDELLSRLGLVDSHSPSGKMRPSLRLPDFDMRLTTGGSVSTKTLLSDAARHGRVRVVFFSSGCEHCGEIVTQLGSRLSEQRSLAKSTLVVIFDDANDARQFLTALGETVRTAVRPIGDQLIGAFGVTGTPSVHEYDASGALMAAYPDLRPYLTSAVQ